MPPMGLDTKALKLLLTARKRGAVFSDSLMLGRQWLLVGQSDLEVDCEAAGVTPTSGRWSDVKGPYAESLFQALGATVIESIDMSPYEGATIVHDMNETLPERLHAKYTAVFDGGTIEHVFNVPMYLRNAAQALRPGGHYIVVTVTDNFSGHGFYQFSPEFWFRVMTPVNGLRCLGVFLAAARSSAPIYSVEDPAVLGRRVSFRTREPTYVMAIAQRIDGGVPFATSPQQSDYAVQWNSAAVTSTRTLREQASRLLMTCHGFIAPRRNPPWLVPGLIKVDDQTLFHR
jgi:hypothetical protein